MRSILIRVSRPGNLLAVTALFFALGGSAFGVTKVVQAAFVVKCSVGAISAEATISASAVSGLANTPDAYTSSNSYFLKRYTCKGGAAQVRRVGVGVYDVRFPGNPATTALVTGLVDTATAVSPRQADGSFRVTVFITGTEQNDLARRDLPFTIVALA